MPQYKYYMQYIHKNTIFFNQNPPHPNPTLVKHKTKLTKRREEKKMLLGIELLMPLAC